VPAPVRIPDRPPASWSSGCWGTGTRSTPARWRFSLHACAGRPLRIGDQAHRTEGRRQRSAALRRRLAKGHRAVVVIVFPPESTPSISKDSVPDVPDPSTDPLAALPAEPAAKFQTSRLSTTIRRIRPPGTSSGTLHNRSALAIQFLKERVARAASRISISDFPLPCRANSPWTSKPKPGRDRTPRPPPGSMSGRWRPAR